MLHNRKIISPAPDADVHLIFLAASFKLSMTMKIYPFSSAVVFFPFIFT